MLHLCALKTPSDSVLFLLSSNIHILKILRETIEKQSVVFTKRFVSSLAFPSFLKFQVSFSLSFTF